MTMTFNDTSSVLLKSIIAEDVDAYLLRFTINFLGSRVSGFGFRRKLVRTKTQQGIDKVSEWVHSIFAGFVIAYAHINRSDVKLVLSFILY